MIEWLLAVAPLGALGVTAFNLASWPRGTDEDSTDVSIAVLIPARNEEETIEGCVRSALAQEGVTEVLVYDDQSTDATPEILRRLAEEDSRLRVLDGVPLPTGWVGKPHACHRLAAEGDADLFLFLDADVTLQEGATRRIGGLLTNYDGDVVTAVPAQETRSFAERLVLPLLHLTYLSWLPLPLIWRSSDPRFLAANGQVLAVRRAAYESAGGFEAVRDAVVDDMAFCRRLKQTGHRVVFADGQEIASCRMYGSAREVWEGFSKNLYEGVGSPIGLFATLLLYFAAFLLPWILPALAPVSPLLGVVGLVGITANLAQRALLIVRFGHPWESIVLHPISILAFTAIAVNSWLWHIRGAIHWSGRSYARKEARNG